MNALPSRIPCFTAVALALSGCGGVAQSEEAPAQQAPRAEPAPLNVPSPAEPPATGASGREPVEPVPGATPASLPVPVQCRGVMGSTGSAAIEVRDQGGLDALADCSTIVGHLIIQPFEGVDLRPLSSLRTVLGTVTLGSPDDDPPASGFPSLEGLDNLESVAGLSLRGVLAPSLRALGSLRRFVQLTDETWLPSKGHLYIDHCPELTELSGLERLEGLVGVTLRNNAKLASLRGIQLPEIMDQLTVSDSPVEDLGDTSRLTEVSALWFRRTALQSAAGLERVVRVDQLQFSGNSALRDLSALSALTEVGYLDVSENPQLEVLPTLGELRVLNELSVTDNARLREIPNISVGYLQSGWIEGNASLERVFALLQTRQVYYLRVADNPQLSVLDLGQLQTLSELWVTNNPALDDTALRRLEPLGSSRVRIAGNLGQTLPLAECPWQGEGFCDDVQYLYGLCVEGTDPDCVLPAD